MYRYWTVCLVLVLSVACTRKQEFSVKGSVENAAGKTLYLENVGVSSIIVLDSVKLNSNGKFSFHHKRPDIPDFYRLRLGEQWINFSVDSTENITVRANTSEDFARSYTIEGSENAKKIKELSRMQLCVSEAFGKLTKERADGLLTEDAYQMKVMEAVDEYKESAKKYILEDPPSAAAYFALFQQIDNMLIFSPYNKDDNKLYSAVATSWDLYYGNAPRAKQLHTLALQGVKFLRNQRQRPFNNITVRETLSYFEISLPDVDGNIVNLSDIVKKGQLIILDFTAYRGQFSPVHNMNLGGLYEKYRSQGIEIFQVSLDTDLNFWQNVSYRIPWICVRDPESVYSRFAATYNVKNLPATFLLNREGDIVKRIENDNDLEAEVKNML